MTPWGPAGAGGAAAPLTSRGQSDPDRNAGLESLKRFKEDVGEVREGFECGMKVASYDDIKVGDVIEAFRIEQVMRTLE